MASSRGILILNKFQKVMLGMALIPALLIVSAGVSLKLLTSPITLAEGARSFEISSGESLTRVASRLHDEGMLQNPRLLVTFARLMGQTNIKLGEYQLPETTSDLEILELVLRGEVVTRQLTLVEGTTFADALRLLSQQSLKQKLIDKSPAEVGQLLGIDQANPEGWLFPDTYQFSKGMTDLDMLKGSVALMRQVLQEEWQGRAENLPYKTPYEALIMASIVEKETGVASERQEIAGVFVRRLQKGMRLQTDPTVIYGLGDSYDGNIRKRHLRQPTPYNTYVIKGLPPTPIALPGRAAIHAALHPADGDTLFFVAKGDGSHYFSVTLAEHEAAVKRYQLQRKASYRSSPKPENQ